MADQMAEQASLKDEKRARLRKKGGEWLKSVREDAGLTQRELAARLDFKIYTFISQLEVGQGKIPLDRYGEWARALKVDEYDFALKAFSYYEPAIYEIVKAGRARKRVFQKSATE